MQAFYDPIGYIQLYTCSKTGDDEHATTVTLKTPKLHCIFGKKDEHKIFYMPGILFRHVCLKSYNKVYWHT